MITALLLSGGMDSVAVAWWKRPQVAFTVDYGQNAAQAEKTAAAQVCRELGIEHHVIQVDCRSLGAGDMSGSAANPVAQTTEWWPYRNQLLVTLACMRAVSCGVNMLYLGTVQGDGSRHQDGLPEFFQRMDGLVAFQEGGLRVQAPAIRFTTAQLIRQSGVPPGLLAWSHSCHRGNVACGDCPGCSKHFSTYDELGSQYRSG